MALALPIFLLADWPLLGYAVIAVVWLVQRSVQVAAERRTARALAEGDRRSAMGVLAWSILGRVWLVTLSILLVGLLGERQDGLAAAILSAVLVTVSFGTAGAGQAARAPSRMRHEDPHEGPARGRALRRLRDRARDPVRQRRQERRVQATERVQARAWINIKIGGIDLSINKVVLYLFLASALTIATMVWISRRMQQKPNKVQMTVEVAYDLTRNNITGGNIEEHRLAAKWFPFLATLFFFIWFSNMIGYIPLPINTERHGRHLRAGGPGVRALRGDREHLDPARADPGGLGLATTSRGSGPRACSPT